MPKNKKNSSIDKKTFGKFERFLPFLEKWLWVIIIIVAIALRFWKIEYIPYANDADELAHVWAGQSLVQYGMPISWSSFEHTDTQWHWTEINSSVVGDKTTPIAKFVRPWFDHSFVLPLIMGTWSLLLGYTFPSIPPALLYRLPFLLIAAGNLTLIYLIAKKIFGKWPALFSLTLVSFSPIFLFAQRMVVAENLTTLFILLTLYFFFDKKPLWTIIITTALAGLVKLPALVILPVIAVALFADKKYRQLILYIVGVFAIVFAGYLLYGMSIDFPAFLSAMKDQSSRLLGWSNPAFILSQPGFHHQVMLDFSYYVILFLGLTIFFLPMNKESRVLTGAILAAFLSIWVTSAEQDMLGWYKIPLFCLLAISAAGVFHLGKSSLDEKKEISYQVWLTLCIFLVIMVCNNFGIVRFPTSPLPEAQLLRGVVAVILLAGLWALQYKVPKKVLLTVTIGALCIFAVQAAYVSDQYFAASCKDRNCPTPFVTLRQVVGGILKK
jgi:4-amino-4-deoxy-L-arabinose transferase-like glycosyltransferase